MSVRRLYLDQPLLGGTEAELPPEAAHYLRNVLRLKAGDDLRVFDGRGTELEARIEILERHDSRLKLGAAVEPRPESPLEITLVQGIARGERMEYAIQKATELGVARIVPVFTRRSGVRLDDKRLAKKLQHWQGVAASACEQCGRAVLPRLDQAPTLVEFCGRGRSAELSLVLDPESTTGLGGHRRTASVELVVGPEGGLDEAELQALRDSGFKGLAMGPRVLRTETAGPAAVAALQALWGDMG